MLIPFGKQPVAEMLLITGKNIHPVSNGGVNVAGFSVPHGTSAEAVFVVINAHIDLLQVRRMPFRVFVD